MKHLISGKVLAIDIGSRSIKLVEGKFRNNQLSVDNCSMTDTMEGAVREGAIIDKLVLKENLKQAVRKNKLSTDKAIITIKNQLVISRDISLPPVPDAELRSMIALEMEQFVPNLATEYVLGFYLLEQNAIDTNQNRFRAVAMPKSIINDYSSIIKEVGLKPVVVDVHANAIAKLVEMNYIRSDSGQSAVSTWNTAAFIDLGYDQTEINIFSAGKPAFTRLLSFGSRQLLADIAREQALSIPKAEEFLIKKADLHHSDGDQIMSMIRTYANRWINEIQTNVQFFVGRSQERRPEAYYIYGGFAGLKGLTDLISSTANVPVRYMDNFPAVNLQKNTQGQSVDLALYANSLGAIIRKE